MAAKKSRGWLLFADIYGFRAMLSEQELSTAASSLLDYQNQLQKHLLQCKQKLNPQEFSFKLFSDLIVIHLQAGPGQIHVFHAMMDVVAALCKTAANHNFLLRGAICFGDVHLGREFILGEAYLRAYLLESDGINSPHIVVPLADLQTGRIETYSTPEISEITTKKGGKLTGIVCDFVPSEQRMRIAKFHITNLNSRSPEHPALEIWKAVWEEAAERNEK